MPIFEFCCNKCKNKFEELIFSHDKVNSIRCPQCKTTDLRKLYSTFGFSSGDSFSSNIGQSCTGCAKNFCTGCSK